MELISETQNIFRVILAIDLQCEDWEKQKTFSLNKLLVPSRFDFGPTTDNDEYSIFVEKSIKIEYLFCLYTMKNPVEIKKFLVDHDFLIDNLIKIRVDVERMFTDALVEVRLEYHKDYEEDYDGLFLVIRTNLSPELALDFLDKFDQEIWLSLDPQSRNQLTAVVRKS